MATVAEQMQWKRDHSTLKRFTEQDKISKGLSKNFDLVDRGTVTKEADLANTHRAPDGCRNWSHNKDFVKYERKRGSPIAVANPVLERSLKDG